MGPVSPLAPRNVPPAVPTWGTCQATAAASNPSRGGVDAWVPSGGGPSGPGLVAMDNPGSPPAVVAAAPAAGPAPGPALVAVANPGSPAATVPVAQPAVVQPVVVQAPPAPQPAPAAAPAPQPAPAAVPAAAPPVPAASATAAPSALGQAFSELAAGFGALFHALGNLLRRLTGQPPLPAAAALAPTGSAPQGPASGQIAAGSVPPDSLAGTHGGQCIVWVEHETGSYFAVTPARDMLEVHPGYDLVSTPQPGDIFVMTGGQYGHTGFVKAVNGDGTLTVIDSNWNDDEVVHVHALPMSQVAGYLRRNGQPDQAYSG